MTGAARGIGAATVRALADDGWAVVATDRCADDPRLPYALGTREELDALSRPGQVITLPADTCMRDELAAAVAAAERDFGGPGRGDRGGGGRRGRGAALGAARGRAAGRARDRPVRRPGRCPGRHPGAAATTGATHWPVHRRLLGGGDDRAAAADGLRRGEGRCQRRRPRPGGGAAWHRHHGERCQSRVDAHADPGGVGQVVRPAGCRAVRPAAGDRAVDRAGGGRAADRLAGRSGRARRCRERICPSTAASPDDRPRPRGLADPAGPAHAGPRRRAHAAHAHRPAAPARP